MNYVSDNAVLNICYLLTSFVICTIAFIFLSDSVSCLSRCVMIVCCNEFRYSSSYIYNFVCYICAVAESKLRFVYISRFFNIFISFALSWLIYAINCSHSTCFCYNCSCSDFYKTFIYYDNFYCQERYRFECYYWSKQTLLSFTCLLI